MKRTYRFVEPSGTCSCTTRGGTVVLPLFAGILKHPTAEELEELVRDPVVAEKYTHEALRKAPWSALRHFPRSWLLTCLPRARLTQGRRRALELMLREDWQGAV